MFLAIFLFLVWFAVVDVRKGKVANLLVCYLLLFVVVLGASGALPFFDLIDNRYRFVLLVVALLLGFLGNVFGAADIKIILILALVIPFDPLLHALMIAFSTLAIWWLLWDRRRREYPFIPFLTLGFGLSLWMHGILL
ncbi:prepilin peptidase [Zobellella denitrificans]|jgi:Flp pilus assembly protein protease CpaA|uniref:Prepilin type IV endopeptidase peptidase domain-containing protein n=1 Tax=Zobellella denitrificans TaxID=347534 RepID=A0A291HQF0_9GAMM|nr:hypothetical protein AN401_11820 [Zobellella denitrificans]